MFIVDDILLTYIVLPYGKRLLDQSRNQLYDWFNSELGRTGKKLVRSISKSNLSDKEVLEHLGHYVGENSGAAETLAMAAFAAEVDIATALPAVEREEEFLRVIRDFLLTPTFEMVKSLGRPTVVPGFLTGADWLAAIDIRVPSGEELEKVRISPRIENIVYSKSEVIPARIEVWTAPGILGVKHWRPRIWLIRPMDEELARGLDTTPGRLSDALDKLACDSYGTVQQFVEALEHQAFVTRITRDHVIVQHARWLSYNSPDTTGDAVLIPWAASPDGIKAMQTSLAKQLGGRQQKDLLWIQALKN